MFVFYEMTNASTRQSTFKQVLGLAYIVDFEAVLQSILFIYF